MAANIEQANALIGELRKTIEELQHENQVLLHEIKWLTDELNQQHDKYYDV